MVPEPHRFRRTGWHADFCIDFGRRVGGRNAVVVVASEGDGGCRHRSCGGLALDMRPTIHATSHMEALRTEATRSHK